MTDKLEATQAAVSSLKGLMEQNIELALKGTPDLAGLAAKSSELESMASVFVKGAHTVDEVELANSSFFYIPLVNEKALLEA